MAKVKSVNSMNVPWTESIFFKDELAKKKLNKENEELATQFHKNGFLVLKNVFTEQELNQTTNAILAEHDTEYLRTKNRRIINLWQGKDDSAKAAANIATSKKLCDTLEMLYGRKAMPFQTLNFKWGSEQKAHSDCIHFSSFPEKYMSGVWVALEDANEENGTVYYYPKSHKLPVYSMQDIIAEMNEVPEENQTEYYSKYYEGFIDQVMKFNGLEKVLLPLKKGDVLIWAANLVHGGSAINNLEKTRWSQVTHYYYDECTYITPLMSNTVTGDYLLKNLTDIRTGKPMSHKYNGQEVLKRPLGPYLHNISRRVYTKISRFDYHNNNYFFRGLAKLKSIIGFFGK